MKHLVVCIAVVGVLGVIDARLHAQTSAVDPAKLDTGARVYASLCERCHGVDGDAIGGVNLKTGQFKRAVTDLDLMNTILRGVPGTAMLSNNVGNADLFALVAYLRGMNDYGARRVSLGDANRGRQIFDGKGACLTCHRVNQRGSYLAPDLTEIGASRSAASLLDTLMNPTATARPGNRLIRAVTRQGETITGRRLNEDTFSVQIVDNRERLLSLWKPDLTEYTVLPTPMPSYRETLTDTERADLLAYLVSLQPRRGAR